MSPILTKVLVKLMTNENIVHRQLQDIPTTLNRELDIKITLKNRNLGSFLELSVSEKEMDVLRNLYGNALFRKNDAGWIPVI